MRVLQGSKQVDASPVLPSGVVIDLGAGDGRWVYESAKADPEGFYVAVDSDATALSEYAYRASRKPSRGGITNALFVVAAAEALPAELHQTASKVQVNFPWSGLLRGLVLPDSDILEAIARLAAATARFEFVICYDPVHDAAGLGGTELPPLNQEYVDQKLAPAYAAHGLVIEQRFQLTRQEALSVPSTWGRRLIHGRRREVFQIEGRFAR